jgi:hypothetical protein
MKQIIVNMDATGEFQNNLEDLENLSSSRYENIFRVFMKDEKYYYNILKRVNIDLSTAASETFTVTKIRFEAPWTNISYQAYGTTDLWWLVYLSNKEQFSNPVDLVPGGTTLKFIKHMYLRSVIDEIETELKPTV